MTTIILYNPQTRKLLRACFFILAASSVFMQTSAASSWPQPDKKILIISRTDYFRVDLGEVNTMDGIVDSQFEKTGADIYVEYGLTRKLTLGGKGIYSRNWLSRGNNVESAAGFSELALFGQYNLFQRNINAASAKLSITRPAGFQSGQRPELQSRGYDFTASVLYGHNITVEPVKIFAVLETGYKKRFSDSADQVEAQATIGIEPNRKWLVLLDFFATKSVENNEAGGVDFDIVKAQPSLVWHATPRWSVQVGVTEEFAGRNIALGRAYFLSIWSRF